MKQFDRTNLRQLRDDLQESLRGIEKQSNIIFRIGSMRFSPTDVRMKLEARIKEVGSTGKVLTPYEAVFNKNCDLKPSDLYKVFTSGGKSFKLMGMKSGGKYPFVAEGLTSGKLYKFRADQVKVGLGIGRHYTNDPGLFDISDLRNINK